MSQLAMYARAMQVLEGYLARRHAGGAESPEELLAHHEDLAEVLASMLADGDVLVLEPPPAPRWRGLPNEGDLVGGYRVERVLGQGGMGVVFAAMDAKLQRKVALKLVHPERLGSATARDRFEREAKLAARLEHPHICPVYEVGEAHGMPFMAMRLLHGETLAARIASRLAPPGQDSTVTRARLDETLQLLEQVARAVHFAHEHGVVHRDIKPGNVLITPDGTPVVLDFGMARAAAGDDPLLTLTGDLAGTPLYMAPEQILGKGPVDPRADVFALGVTLYEALTGVRPFSGQSLRELQDAILSADPLPPSRHVTGLPHDLDVVIAKALDKDAAHRYVSAAAFADDLARVRRREPVLARLPGPWLRLGRWAQRNPLAVSLLALGAVVLATISYLYLWGQGARRDFHLVSLVPRLRELHGDDLALYRAWPDHGPALGAWLVRAESVLAEAPAVQVALARLEGSTALEERFLHETLRMVLDDCDALRAEPGGALPRARLDFDWNARELALARAAQAGPAGELWTRTIAAIAAEPVYKGLRLARQVGLIPLGQDAKSRFFEFHHVRSGAAPEREADGHLRVTDATGIVFVLLPGGEFTMGCDGRLGAEQHDARARPEEVAHKVTLAPFFIGKHELTQGQWLRLSGGTNPSDIKLGSRYQDPDAMPRVVQVPGPLLTHPVESVQWGECTALLERSGLELPTEAQWEYACRGGTQTPWWTGDEPGSVDGRMNLADLAAFVGGVRWREIDKKLDDGYPLHAPVDAFAANGFGLFQMTGNVWEWCRDEYLPYESNPVRAGDGLRQGKGTGKRVARGGAFDMTVDHARSAMRRYSEPAMRQYGLGLRAARPVR